MRIPNILPWRRGNAKRVDARRMRAQRAGTFRTGFGWVGLALGMAATLLAAPAGAPQAGAPQGGAPKMGDTGAHKAGLAEAREAGLPKARKAGLAEASEALRKAIAFHREAKDLTLRFRAETYNAPLDKREKYTGKLLLKDSTRFRLEIPGGTFVSDGATFWEYHPKNKQVVVRRAGDLKDKPMPGQVLLRFLDSDPLSVEKIKYGGKPALRLSLDPSRAMKDLDSLTILLDPADFSLRGIHSRDLSGNEAEYTLVSVKRNGGISDGVFGFSVPKGVETVDMRD